MNCKCSNRIATASESGNSEQLANLFHHWRKLWKVAILWNIIEPSAVYPDWFPGSVVTVHTSSLTTQQKHKFPVNESYGVIKYELRTSILLWSEHYELTDLLRVWNSMHFPFKQTFLVIFPGYLIDLLLFFFFFWSATNPLI